jgi:hypothetical protein
MIQSPSIAFEDSLIWRSPDFPGWSLSLKTPDLAALMSMLVSSDDVDDFVQIPCLPLPR